MGSSPQAVCQVRFDVADPSLALRLCPSLRPQAAPGQIVVRITLRPINPSDLGTIRSGRLAHLRSAGLDVVIGGEGVGIVEEVGEGVTKVRKGQRVIPLDWKSYLGRGQGTWQDYMVLNEEDAIEVPDSVSDEVAAQSIVNPWTVYSLLQVLAIPKGEYLLQAAAGSVLGRQMIQLARHQGIKTINLVRRDEWRPELEELGADVVINSETEDVAARVKEITHGKLAYGAIDPVAGTLTQTIGACVRDGGVVVLYGMLSGTDLLWSINNLRRGVKLDWFYLPDYILPFKKRREETALAVWNLLEKQIITPLVGKKFKLTNFKEAIIESEIEGRRGKVLLVS